MVKLQWLPGWPMIIDHDQKHHNHHCHHHDHDQKRPGWHACPRDPGTLRLLTVSRLFARIYTQWSAWWGRFSRWRWLSRWYLPHDYHDHGNDLSDAQVKDPDLKVTVVSNEAGGRIAFSCPQVLFLIVKSESESWCERNSTCMYTYKKMRTVRGSPSTILFSFLLVLLTFLIQSL